MYLRPAIGCLAALSLGLLPAAAFAQSVDVKINRSILPDQPFTLIYPSPMTASGEPGGTLTINHPNAPLQCYLTVVPVQDTAWTAEGALAALDDAKVAEGWAADFAGFTLGAKSVAAYQSGPALMYEGTSTDSPMDVPLTIVHTEAVDTGRGYTLDCFFATAEAAQARPIVNFIITNFSTRADAECCQGMVAEDAATEPTQPVQ